MASTPSAPESKPQRRYVLPSEQQMLNRVALFQRILHGTSNVLGSVENGATGLVPALPVVDSTRSLLDGVPDSNFQDFAGTGATGLLPALPVADSADSLLNSVPDFNLQDSTEFVALDAVSTQPFNPTQLDFLNWFQNPFGLTGNATGPLHGIKHSQQHLTYPTDGITGPNWIDILCSMSSGYTGVGGTSHVVDLAASGENSSADGTNSRSLGSFPLDFNAWTNPTISASTGFAASTRMAQTTQPSLPQEPLTFFSPTRKLHMMQQALLAKASNPLKPGTPEFEKLFMEAVEYAKNNPIYEDKKIELIRIQHLQNHPIASSVVHLDHSDSSSAFKEYHPYLNRLQGQANNLKALIDSMAQPPFIQLHGPMIPPILATDFSTSPFFQQLQLHQGPVGTPNVLENDVESKKVIKNHRRNRLRLKKTIRQVGKLTQGTTEFDEKFKEAKEYYDSCEVYKDERIKILKNYLFDPSKNTEMPQKVDIINISTRTIYNHWAKQNGLGRRAKWKDIAAKVDEEQETQLRLGFINGDKEQGQGAEDSSDNN
ncbi:hypothetical protein CAEBREN_15752 [Caenorhabditis brenneri]|uniref:Uncharacterized protein n=1 Tax=Caenorhabditis brenneri TaxID=135651 RepID=G0MMR6_CAEBE|nr:hypothetical protein CAEBREN_15752 [Caenorhabditis brenneri]